MVRGCLSVSQTNGYGCEVILAVYADGELTQLSRRTLDPTFDGVYEVYAQTERLTVEKDESLAKLIIINSFEEMKPY
ncbi:MAG: hypothetical protein E7395_02495 [Ruminococcaceae bacterium]|nr:hypothetical protein [Oscillospiraceae bacterium]